MRTTSVSRYHLNSLISHYKGHEESLRFVISALCDWLSPVYAITGNSVMFYSLTSHVTNVTDKFLHHLFQTTSALFPCGCFHHGLDHRHPSLSGLGLDILCTTIARTTSE